MEQCRCNKLRIKTHLGNKALAECINCKRETFLNHKDGLYTNKDGKIVKTSHLTETRHFVSEELTYF